MGFATRTYTKVGYGRKMLIGAITARIGGLSSVIDWVNDYQTFF